MEFLFQWSIESYLTLFECRCHLADYRKMMRAILTRLKSLYCMTFGMTLSIKDMYDNTFCNCFVSKIIFHLILLGLSLTKSRFLHFLYKLKVHSLRNSSGKIKCAQGYLLYYNNIPFNYQQKHCLSYLVSPHNRF